LQMAMVDWIGDWRLMIFNFEPVNLR